MKPSPPHTSDTEKQQTHTYTHSYLQCVKQEKFQSSNYNYSKVLHEVYTLSVSRLVCRKVTTAVAPTQTNPLAAARKMHTNAKPAVRLRKVKRVENFSASIQNVNRNGMIQRPKSTNIHSYKLNWVSEGKQTRRGKGEHTTTSKHTEQKQPRNKYKMFVKHLQISFKLVFAL